MNRLHLFLLALLLASTAAQAEPATHDYVIKALGIKIGTGRITVGRDLAAYRMTFTGEFSGIAAIFTGAHGTMDMAGSFDAAGAHTATIDGKTQWDKKIRHTVGTFKDGTVVDFAVTPKYSYDADQRVPLDRADLHDVSDPLSAMLRPLPNGKLDCTPRLRIFDGHERYDLQFQPTADPWTCAAQPIPMSGYDYRHKSPQNPGRPVLISFAPETRAGDAAPDMAVPTRFVRDMLIGTVEVVRNDYHPPVTTKAATAH